jgi:diguanylate cyclase (GGDEF)-like protein/PAS domain S-box-containing protein
MLKQQSMLQILRRWIAKLAGVTAVPVKALVGTGDERQYHRRTKDLLALCEARYQAILESQTDLIYRLLPDGVLTFVNEAYCRYFGHSYDEVLATNFMLVIAEADRPAAMARIAACGVRQPMVRHEHRVIRADGAVRWLDCTVQAILGEEDALIELQVVGRDITEQRQTEQALRDSEERYRRIVQTAGEGIWLIDAADRTTFINVRLTQLLGHSPDEMLGKSLFEFIPAESRPLIEIHLQRCRDGVAGQYECPLIGKDCGEIWALLSTNRILDNEGGYSGILVMLVDITVRKQMEDSLRRLAIQDPLTGLFNRRHFFTLADQEFERSQRYDRPLALLMLDIDHFKKINDFYGHPAGDQVLCAVAAIIHNCLRQVDLLARYGGEEFVILLPETMLLTAMAVAQRIIATLNAATIPTEQGAIQVTASIGLAALTTYTGQTLTQLLDWADRALYDAKQSGRNQVHSRVVAG